MAHGDKGLEIVGSFGSVEIGLANQLHSCSFEARDP
jgi:hypothetical protein